MCAPTSGPFLYTKDPDFKILLEKWYQTTSDESAAAPAPPSTDSSLASLAADKGSRRKRSFPRPSELRSVAKDDQNLFKQPLEERPASGTYSRFSNYHATVELVLTVELPEDKEKAVDDICSFFSTSMGDGMAALNVTKAILRYPEKEALILKALEQTYTEILNAPSSQETSSQRDRFFTELLHIISYNKPETIALISKFFMENLENGCKASGHPEIISSQRSDFVEKLFTLYDKKKEFKKLFAAIIGVDIQGASPETLLRENYLSTYLAHFAITRCVQDSLKQASDKLGVSKKGVIWLDQHQRAIEVAFDLVKNLEESPELREISMVVAEKARGEFSSKPKNEQEELVQRVLGNLILLRAVNPYFVHSHTEIGIQFAKFLQQSASGVEYQINTHEMTGKIQRANEAFSKAVPDLQRHIRVLLAYLAGSGGLQYNPLRRIPSSISASKLVSAAQPSPQGFSNR